MESLILKNISVSKSLVEYEFTVTEGLKKYFNDTKMFIEYDVDISHIPSSILVIPFVASLLPLMWLTDSVMWVEEIDRTFYDAILRLKNAYQDLYAHVTLKGRFVAAQTIINSYVPERESLLLFSGGLDANTTYINIKEKTPILCNIQGWYKDLDCYDKAAESDKRAIKDFAIKNDLQYSSIRSNFAVIVNVDFFDRMLRKKFKDSWWHGFQHSMSFISIAIPVAFLNNIANIYIASSFSIGNIGKCASYPTTDIEFKFATEGGVIHDGFELTRQEKVGIMVNYQKSTGEDHPIRVCSFNDINCCECEKCFRTILGIVAEGGDVASFGFEINKGLTEHFKTIMKQKLALFGVVGESAKHWPDIKKRMKENYDNVTNKEFIDWFLCYDFIKERKKALFKYRIKNIFPILKRKFNLLKSLRN